MSVRPPRPDLPPKPQARKDSVSLWQYLALFRRDILSAQPIRLYGAWMAEFRTPFFRSYLLNQPELIKRVLKTQPVAFPKSDRIGAGLRPLLGNSVFLTNGAEWQRQRRIIDPAFQSVGIRQAFPAMWAAGLQAVARLRPHIGQKSPVEIEFETSHLAADVIFRTLFSLPITNQIATQMFEQFKIYQRSQPLLNAAAFFGFPHWFPRFFRGDTRRSARSIRRLITKLTKERMDQIKAGTAPDDLATKIMTQRDPETDDRFSIEEMVDQVAIFFLAGHETSASALAWALYLLATHPDWQEQVAKEAAILTAPDYASVAKLKLSRDVFRETLRLYPPVPMMVRQSTCPVTFRNCEIAPGSQMVVSPWHLHRHTRLWDNPDGFDPARWHTENGKACQRDAYIPFSTGPRVCIGAGFAMVEGPLLLSMLVKNFRFEALPRHRPTPVAHLTVRSKSGIWLNIHPRSGEYGVTPPVTEGEF